MHVRHIGNDWQKALWKILSNPAIEVVAAIVVVVFATWIVVLTDVEQRGLGGSKGSHVPVLFDRK